MKKIKDCRGEIRGPIMTSAPGDRKTICELIRQKAKEKGIPVNVSYDEVSSGGLFGKAMPCLIVSHPNPPMSYFDHMIIINGNVYNFQFWGNSKANYNNNMKEMDRKSGTISGMIKSAIRSDMSMELQTEHLWHQQVASIYEEIFV